MTLLAAFVIYLTLAPVVAVLLGRLCALNDAPGDASELFHTGEK
jgi:hypothetical protein